MAEAVHIVAAGGIRHGGILGNAERLIEVAASAGADSLSLEIAHPESLLLPDRQEAGRLKQNELFDRYVASMFSMEDYSRIIEGARRLGLAMGFTVFDERAVAVAEAFDPPYLRIDSGDLTYHRLIREAAITGRKLLLSTGMASLAEIEAALDVVWKAGGNDVVLLHAVDLRPASLERMNLAFLDVLRQAFGTEVGLSDLTEDSYAAAIAVGKGAAFIEKDLALDEPPTSEAGEQWGLQPDEFATFVADMRRCEAACRWRRPKVGSAEMETREKLRRGLYAAREIEEGQKIGLADVLVVRPPAAMEPDQLDNLIGRTARRKIARFEPFSTDMVLAPWTPG